jgi:hypothetical protein
MADPDSEATRADLHRLGWVLLLVWLVLGGMLVLLAPVLGWALAIGLVSSIGALFTLGIVAVAVVPLVVDWLQRTRQRRRP